jgi:thioredoxin reductase
VLIATGLEWRQLDAPGIERLTGAGVYYGGTLAEAFLCRNDSVAIVGGGSSAGQAALLEREPFWLESCVPGVFVAGHVRHGSVKRVAAGAGERATAAQFIHRYLRSPQRFAGSRSEAATPS